MGEALLFLDGWVTAHASTDEKKAEAPSDDEFEAAIMASARRQRHGAGS